MKGQGSIINKNIQKSCTRKYFIIALLRKGAVKEDLINTFRSLRTEKMWKRVNGLFCCCPLRWLLRLCVMKLVMLQILLEGEDQSWYNKYQTISVN